MKPGKQKKKNSLRQSQEKYASLAFQPKEEKKEQKESLHLLAAGKKVDPQPKSASNMTSLRASSNNKTRIKVS